MDTEESKKTGIFLSLLRCVIKISDDLKSEIISDRYSASARHIYTILSPPNICLTPTYLREDYMGPLSLLSVKVNPRLQEMAASLRVRFPQLIFKNLRSAFQFFKSS